MQQTERQTDRQTDGHHARITTSVEIGDPPTGQNYVVGPRFSSSSPKEHNGHDDGAIKQRQQKEQQSQLLQGNAITAAKEDLSPG